MISVIGRYGLKKKKKYTVYNTVLFSIVKILGVGGKKNPENFNNSLLSSFLLPLHSFPKQQKSQIQNLRRD